jgi:GTPase SAR1 family protein
MKKWDISGHERFRKLQPSYYGDCDGIILVFDVSNKVFETRSIKYAQKSLKIVNFCLVKAIVREH